LHWIGAPVSPLVHQEYESDLKSLARMLEAFEKDRPGLTRAGTDSSPETAGPSAAAPSGDAPSNQAQASGMQLVMRSYEAEIRRPLRSLLLGDLARAMLIQVGG